MNFRKVKFNKWIPRVDESTGLRSAPKEGTNCFETTFPNSGMFHRWANAYEESSEGFGNYTVAIIETSDGTIQEVLPKNVKFVDGLVNYLHD